MDCRDTRSNIGNTCKATTSVKRTRPPTRSPDASMGGEGGRGGGRGSITGQEGWPDGGGLGGGDPLARETRPYPGPERRATMGAMETRGLSPWSAGRAGGVVGIKDRDPVGLTPGLLREVLDSGESILLRRNILLRVWDVQPLYASRTINIPQAMTSQSMASLFGRCPYRPVQGSNSKVERCQTGWCQCRYRWWCQRQRHVPLPLTPY